MKLTFLMMLLIFLITFSLSAQTTIGITAGVSFANVTAKAQGISASPKLKTGFTAGIVLNAPLSANFNFQPALNFVQKGYKVKDDVGTETVTFNYLEVPLDFVYSTKRNEGFFIGAGPSIAYGISGMDKLKYAGSGMPDDNQKVKFGSGVDEVKGLDFGINAIAGYRLTGGLMIGANYNLGLSKINNDDGSGGNGTIKNKYFSLKIGYTFVKKVK
ncbi:MAG: porin family protein [Ginsengibacter sp.]